ncbi:hypothetical protein Q5P01_003010 [Channa striata]|uniref:Ig-like domain-containing protein n=1 Tax=Channa striata TaxID=64152 RepID=A0AA88T5A4_CHASR|nr:hypothetical protein Q5P01_003010 [Channa striata]
MAAITSISVFWTLLFVCVQLSATQANTTGERGGTVTLPCQVSSNRTIIVVEWTRTEPQTKGYVFLYRDEQIDPENQHLSFKNRLELKDSKMKDGDASLILKNLNTDDTGTYKCHVVQAGTKTWTSFTNLTVTDSDKDGGDKDGHVGLVAGLSFVGVLLLVACITGGFVMYKKHKGGSTY